MLDFTHTIDIKTSVKGMNEMVRRFFIELILLLSLLMFCGIYGAVTVRDAGQPGTSSASEAATAPIIIPKQQTETPITRPDQTPKFDSPQRNTQTQAGLSLSEKISRFFLWMVSLIAGMIEGLMQAFF